MYVYVCVLFQLSTVVKTQTAKNLASRKVKGRNGGVPHTDFVSASKLIDTMPNRL